MGNVQIMKTKKDKQIITKDMHIDDVIRKYPKIADIFIKYGLHCIGCTLANWETIEEGAQAHGMNKKMISQMINEANKSANNSKNSKKP